MFWDNFYHLCELRNTTPNAVCKELNLSTATATHWKNGTMPKGDVLFNLANLLDCSVDYLLGRVDEPTATIKTVQGYAPPKILEEQNNLDELSKELLKTFKKLSFRDKISVLNYALNIESPPQIVQTKKQEVKGPEQVPYVARGGQSTKGIINISAEDLLKGETDDYDKY